MAAYGGKEEQLAKSMEALDISKKRPDIKAAEDASTGIKSKLVYRDEEELDTGVQKVQPLPFLDEEIQKYHAQIRDSVAPAQRVNDTIPSQVLRKVDRATAMAQEGETSLFKASQLLELTFEAYQYARGAAQDQFDLKRTSEQYLARFEVDFKNMIKYRLEADLPQAAVELENCQRALEKALEESKGDVHSQEARAKEEDAVIEDSSLQESHEQVQEMVRVEKNELNTIGDQCLRDMKTIDEELRALKKQKDSVDEQCRLQEAKRAKQFEKNRKDQRELKEKLQRLKDDEVGLLRKRETNEQLQQTADEKHAATEREMMGWREKIEHLRARTETSLGVMRCMEECTDMIMEDAKGKKMKWKERLRETAIESRWIMRESLVIKGAAFTMVLEDNKSNAAESTKLISHYDNEKISAARSGFAPRVNDAKRCIEQYTAARTEYEQKIAESSEIIKTVRRELAALDEKLLSLRPALKLDTIENRYEDLKQKKSQAFTAMNIDGVVFSFYHRLPR